MENADNTDNVQVAKDGVEVEVPSRLAELLIKHRGWVVDEADADKIDPEKAEPFSVRAAPRTAEPELNPEAACDDDLPEGIVFADSAYETVVDEETGEKVRVLKTHCRNGHEYAGNVKIRVRGDKAYRECQTCLAGRRERAKKVSKK